MFCTVPILYHYFEIIAAGIIKLEKRLHDKNCILRISDGKFNDTYVNNL